ncbi:DNA adenine methylase [Bacillus bombysepticus]|uniref:DNA adenine methylase n=1 Tax=Bacillus bombysepticus TaxID=658666 RepID=UPI00301B2C32
METLECQFCEEIDKKDSDTFQLDKLNTGFWCELCDGYSYFDRIDEKHKFTLILEDKSKKPEPIYTNTIKLPTRISPYRYPGGKTKVVNYLYTHLQKTKSKKLISPFVGGGSFELALLDAGIIDELHMNDLDTGVYSLWWVIKHMPYVIIDRLQSKKPTHKDYFKAQNIIKSNYVGVDAVDAAWASLLVNRLAYSGIPKANPLGGRNGTSEALLSRWNTADLIRRIERIHSLSDKITVTQEDATKLIEEAYWEDTATIFIDPPYVEKGKDLYNCFYTEDDHVELSVLLDSLHMGCPGADIVLTYDYNEWLEKLYNYPIVEVIGRKYSV